MDQIEALRAVVQAAREWVTSEDVAADNALCVAVTALEATIVRKPAGFVVTRTWGELLPGQFVRTPRGEWWEVTSSHLDGDRQMVALRTPGGETGTFPRDPAGTVSARVRSTPGEVAVDMLREAFGVGVLDAPPWDTSDLHREFAEAAKGTITEWCRRWPGSDGGQFRARYFENGTVEIERETDTGFDRATVLFDVTVTDAS